MKQPDTEQNWLFSEELVEDFAGNDIAFFVHSCHEGDSVELELIVEEFPLFVRDKDVLALDVVVLHPLFCLFARAVSLVADIQEAHGLVFQPFYLLALVEHIGLAGTAVHCPEVEIERIALVGRYEALKECIGLGSL